MKNWTELRKELRKEFGKFYFFNDKNKYTRRIKIIGAKKYQIKEYLEITYPGMIIWETNTSNYGGYYNGVCFNLNH